MKLSKPSIATLSKTTLRHCEAKPKQSIKNKDKTQIMDCHDLTASNLAMTENTLKNISNSSSNNTFTPPFEIPPTWAWVRLGDIIEIISGTSYSKSDLTDNGIRILRGGNIAKNSQFIQYFADDVMVKNNLANMDKTIKQNDIIITGTNDKENIAKCAIVKECKENTQIGAFLRIVRVKKPNLADYVFCIFSSNDYKKYLQSCVSGTVTSLLNVKNEYLENFLIPLPPLNEQEFISLELEKLFKLSKNLRLLE